MKLCRSWLPGILPIAFAMAVPASEPVDPSAGGPVEKIYVVPIREDIMPPLVYLVRRGVKEAMDAGASTLILDMDTNGGRVDTTEEIIGIVSRFPGKTVTYVNRKAFSAGAFISVATRHIYMAPESVIGAAAPVMMSPGGGGAQEMPSTMEKKAVSAISALIRAQADKNGHNTDVVQAMIDQQMELKIDDQVISAEGELLTLTNTEAEKEYGDPPKALLSAGTFESLDALILKLGGPGSEVHRIEPTGAERLAIWLNAISPILMMIGIVGIYLEMKTPGFGIPGIVGVIAFVLFFVSSYVAGLAGMEWLLLFLLGIALLVVEIFIFPGTLIFGLTGAALVVVSMVMALADYYPGTPVLPNLPEMLGNAVPSLVLGLAGTIVVIWALWKTLPHTPVYNTLVSSTASGSQTAASFADEQKSRLGRIGESITPLRPGGKARFGDTVINVVVHGDTLPAGTTVKIVGASGNDPVVEPVDNEG